MTRTNGTGAHERRALVVGDAAGPLEAATAVLARFGFGGIEQAADVRQALDRMRTAHYDLVILPLQDLDTSRLAVLEREIRGASSTAFIGTAPARDPDVILRGMRAGVQEFLVTPPDAADLATAVERLMRRHHAEARRGAVFAVYSSKGGQGSTTIAVNVAAALARRGPDARVALADFAVANGDVRVMLNLRPMYDMGSLLEKLDRVDAELLYSLLTPYGEGLWVLPAAEDPERDDELDASATTTLIDHLRAHFVHTVIDCEHHLNDRTLAALDAADRVLLVTQMTVPALRATQRTLALSQRLGYPDDKICVIVNRFQSGDVLSPADATALLKRELFWKLPNDYKVCAASLTKGVTIAEFDAASKLAWSFGQLAAKLEGGVAAHAANGNAATGASRLRRLFQLGKRS